MKQKVAEFQKEFFLSDSIDKTFDALTNAENLRIWFADNVEIDPRKEGNFRFWGKQIPWLSHGSDAKGKIQELVPARSFHFDWNWRGASQKTTIDLSSDSSKTKLALRHTSYGDLGFQGDDDGIAKDFWTVSIGNLRSFLKTKQAALTCDYTDPSDTVALSIEIDRPADEVFQLLATKENLDQCISTNANIDPRTGGDYSFGWTFNGHPIGPTKLIEFAPGLKLVHNWLPGGHGDTETKVIWTVERLGDNRSRLAVKHGPFKGDMRHATTQGWAGYLHIFKSYGEGERLFARPFSYAR